MKTPTTKLKRVLTSSRASRAPQRRQAQRLPRAQPRQEPVPHREILEVTAIVQAGAKSLAEKSRMVPLAEVLG